MSKNQNAISKNMTDLRKSKIILKLYTIFLKSFIPGKIIKKFRVKFYTRKLRCNVLPVWCIRFRAVDSGRVHMTSRRERMSC